MEILPFSNTAEDFGNSTLNLYYSTPSTLKAVASLLISTRASKLQGSTTTTTVVTEPQHTVTFLDLGCGDGRYCIYMATHFGIKSTGVDFSPATIAEATANAEEAGVSHLCTFLLQDFMLWDSIPKEYTWVSAYVPKTLLWRLRGVVEDWLKMNEESEDSDSSDDSREPRLFVSILWQMKGWEERKLAAADQVMTLWVADKTTVS
ncbi:S-adenosyl-L-methionine-dependent methyltransferase [Obelidium mucronatum]|nr:S-adenosyl-L-methionine-dependent methyltransferase [Obelidium mucronatum]